MDEIPRSDKIPKTRISWITCAASNRGVIRYGVQQPPFLSVRAPQDIYLLQNSYAYPIPGVYVCEVQNPGLPSPDEGILFCIILTDYFCVKSSP